MIKIFLLVAIGVIATISAATDKIVCYYGNWAVYRSGNGKFDVSDIDPTLCTHLIYAFVGLNADGSVKILDSNTGITQSGFQKFNNLRSVNSNLKTLIAIGGWNEGSTTYSNMVASAALRTTFISSSIKFLETYGFDGFDLDWEYPCQRGGVTADKVNFATLLKEMRAEYDKKGYLLTAAVAAASSSVDLSYDVPALSQYLDFINVMTYDLHGSWDGITGQNSPLYASSIDITATQKMLNVESCISGWLSRGASPSKLMMGVGTYGRSFTLSSSTNAKLGAPTTGAGTAGTYTGESGFLGYNEICQNVQSGWTVVWDDEQKVPYAHKGNQWVGYDNPTSIAAKVDFAKAKGLGGIMVWSLETDDFKGTCGTKNAILNQIRTSLGLPTSPSSPSTTVTSTTAPVTGSETVCTTSGYIRDATDCNKYYYCQPITGGYKVTSLSCPSGLYYDLTLEVCNWPYAVSC